MDIVTPRNVFFNAFYKRSFAYFTMKERLPIILTQTIDNLVRNKESIVSEFGEESEADLKWAIGEISKLKYEVQTDKPLQEISPEISDAKIYNDYITKQATDNGWPTYFNSIWILSECYIYTRINEIFEKTKTLKEFDPFSSQKKLALLDSIESITSMCITLSNLLLKEKTYETKEMFINLLKLNLWGNKQDLSISNGVVDNVTEDPMNSLGTLDDFIISNQAEDIWLAISDTEVKSQTVDIILDNAAYELFFDFCLADFIITNNLASKVRFYPKKIPWFISDATEYDISWETKQLKKNSNENVAGFGKRWLKYFKLGIWSVEIENFWTYPFDFSYMKCVDNALYKKLGEAKLAIFKGDLNYRKLFGERNWDPVTPVEEALQGFHPTKLCTLRTVKCDLVCGLKDGLVDELEVKNKKWAFRGDYGLIQFCGRVEE